MVPTKLAMKRLAGRSKSSIGVPTCWITPASSTATRSADRQRLFLVVGDEDRRDAELALQRKQFGAHVHPQLGIEIRQRLVEQQHLGLDRDGARERDALLLAAGELVRPARAEFGEAHQVERGGDVARDLVARQLALLQPEGDVVRTVMCGHSA